MRYIISFCVDKPLSTVHATSSVPVYTNHFQLCVLHHQLLCTKTTSHSLYYIISFCVHIPLPTVCATSPVSKYTDHLLLCVLHHQFLFTHTTSQCVCYITSFCVHRLLWLCVIHHLFQCIQATPSVCATSPVSVYTDHTGHHPYSQIHASYLKLIHDPVYVRSLIPLLSLTNMRNKIKTTI